MSVSNIFKVNECCELMDKILALSEILDSNNDNMSEGVFLKIYDKLKELYDCDVVVRANAYSQKKSRRSYPRRKYTQQQYRILAEQYPDKYACCPICETGMLKENIKLHYQKTQKCKDIYYTKRGVELAGESIDPAVLSMIKQIYGEPVPPLCPELVEAGANAPYNWAAGNIIDA